MRGLKILIIFSVTRGYAFDSYFCDFVLHKHSYSEAYKSGKTGAPMPK